MSQYSYSSLKRLTIFVETCLESLNLGGEGRDQTISKDCSPHLSFVPLNRSSLNCGSCSPSSLTYFSNKNNEIPGYVALPSHLLDLLQ